MDSMAFVIGQPITHSKSPLIHNFWLKTNGLKGKYGALNISKENLEQFIIQIKSGKYVGGNITLPHKVDVIQYCDQLTISAKRISAVNTIYFRSDILVGDNTDGYGFLANLDQQALAWDAKLDRAIILGAGGAARAIVDALQQRHAKEIIILNRTLSTAQSLATAFKEQSGVSKIIAGKLIDFHKYAPKTDILVNTTSIGLNNTSFDQFDLDILSKNALVTDIVYTPLLTPLLASAQARGHKTVDGLGMLLHQAAPGFEKWFGVFPEVTKELRNLVISDMEKN